MRILRQLGIIFIICFLGILIEYFLPFAFPASIISMVFLFVLLKTGLLKSKSIHETSDFLLKNMGFLFIPSGVSILNYFPIFQSIWLPFLVICLVSTIMTFLATVYTVRFITHLMKRLAKPTTSQGGAKL